MSPVYEFKAPDGRIVEEFFHGSEAPEPGAFVEIGGERCMRIMSFPQACVKPDVRFLSYSLPPGQRQKDGSFKSPYSKTTDSRGRPTFTSMGNVKEANAISRDIDGPYVAKWE